MQKSKRASFEKLKSLIPAIILTDLSVSLIYIVNFWSYSGNVELAIWNGLFCGVITLSGLVGLVIYAIMTPGKAKLWFMLISLIVIPFTFYFLLTLLITFPVLIGLPTGLILLRQIYTISNTKVQVTSKLKVSHIAKAVIESLIYSTLLTYFIDNFFGFISGQISPIIRWGLLLPLIGGIMITEEFVQTPRKSLNDFFRILQISFFVAFLSVLVLSTFGKYNESTTLAAFGWCLCLLSGRFCYISGKNIYKLSQSSLSTKWALVSGLTVIIAIGLASVIKIWNNTGILILATSALTNSILSYWIKPKKVSSLIGLSVGTSFGCALIASFAYLHGFTFYPENLSNLNLLIFTLKISLAGVALPFTATLLIRFPYFLPLLKNVDNHERNFDFPQLLNAVLIFILVFIYNFSQIEALAKDKGVIELGWINFLLVCFASSRPISRTLFSGLLALQLVALEIYLILPMTVYLSANLVVGLVIALLTSGVMFSLFIYPGCVRIEDTGSVRTETTKT